MIIKGQCQITQKMLEKISALRLPNGANSDNKNACYPNFSPKVVIALIGDEMSMAESVWISAN